MTILKTIKLAAAAALTCFTTVAMAQSVYVKAGAGYHFGVASQTGYNSTSTNTATPTGYNFSNKIEASKMNLGKGVTGNGAVGYMISENIGLELGVGYLVGGKSSTKNENTFSSSGSSTHTTTETDFFSRLLLIQPSLVVSAGREGINPYARFGFIAAKGTVYNQSTSRTENTAPNFPNPVISTTDREYESSGGWGKGVQGGLGVEFSMGNKLSIFTELTMTNLAYAPRKRVMKKYSVDDINKLNDLKTWEKEVEFEDLFEENSTNPPADTEPSKALKSNLPLSTIGIGAGIKFSL